ncbi:septal ring lytic transglycosylase RlpA family protein [Ramlibacter humi]|uniref:septal ring lytic transglycosylase RlpA family protein n=1 Tax=Ramlibacter humi TaxID=2530451 RepID=UPI003F6CE127
MRAWAALLLAGFASCGAWADEAGEPFGLDKPLPETPQLSASPSPVVEEGPASWYGLAFHGRRTASGERFDMKAFTAAHPWLPFGTRVLVRNPRNGRSIVVRINDRGPHVAGRIIDLSHAAAQALGLLGVGTRSVVLTLAQELPPRRRGQQQGRP